MGDVSLFIQLFVVGAFFVFLAFGAATLVMIIHLTSMPEGRRARREQEQATPSASFAD
jgi:uncharacterized membrane protein YccF (DUF307 family)